jgi:hypothetical protein
MKTSEEMFGLPEIDVDHFLSNQLCPDESREAYNEMTSKQKMMLRHAIRYGQMQMKGHIEKAKK